MRICFVLFAAVIFCSQVEASEIDKVFLFNGKPIPPICIESLLHQEAKGQSIDSVQLSKCASKKPNISKDYSEKPDERGFYGYEEYDEELAGMRTPFMEYRPLGILKNGNIVVYWQESGGGTGIFSSIVSLKRENETIAYVETLAGGDRCNGGIKSVIVEDGYLKHSTYLTPSDIFPALELNYKIEPYKDLESSAASCYATADYKDGKLDTITLTSDEVPLEDSVDEEWYANYTYQKCFSYYYWDYVRSGSPVKMTIPEAKNFAEGFKKTCMKDK